jgi:hypothetical protein
MSSTPTTTRTPATTVSDLTKKKQTADLITHLGRTDNHLWQALTSMQDQANQLTENVADLASAIRHLANSTNAPQPAVPGSGGTAGGAANSGGSGGNTRPLPPRPVFVP